MSLTDPLLEARQTDANSTLPVAARMCTSVHTLPYTDILRHTPIDVLLMLCVQDASGSFPDQSWSEIKRGLTCKTVPRAMQSTE